MPSKILRQIDLKSPIPKYYQIYIEIKNAIDEEKLIEGDILYSENQLQDYFDVSRVTVRKALEQLEREGYIQRSSGKGTVIQNYRNAFHWSRLTSFTNDLQKAERVSSIVLDFKELAATRKIAKLLEIEEGETVYYLNRIRLINGKKVALSTCYISSRVPVKLAADMFDEQTSLFAILTKSGLEIGDCDETIEAKIPTNEVRDILEMDDSSAIFHRERITYDTVNKPFEYATIYYNAEYYRYYIKNGQSYRDRYGAE